MIKTILLIASNLAFIPAATLAFCNQNLVEGFMYIIMTIISSVYHYVDTYGCIYKHFGCFKTMYMMDFFFAYSMIYTGAASIVNTRKNQSQLKHVLSILSNLIILYSILDDINTLILGVIVANLCIVYIVLSLVILKNKCVINVPNLVVGIIFIICGICMFYAENIHNYYVLHSLWHVSIGVGLFFVMASNVCDGNIITLVTRNHYGHIMIKLNHKTKTEYGELLSIV